MSAVIDASVAVAALIDVGLHGTWAEQIIEAAPVHAPELIRVEVTNVLRRLERTGHISTAEANAAHEDFMQLDIELFSFEPFADRIWALRHDVPSYDAWYVAVAEALSLPLATLDERLCRAKGLRCEFLAPGMA